MAVAPNISGFSLDAPKQLPYIKGIGFDKLSKQWPYIMGMWFDMTNIYYAPPVSYVTVDHMGTSVAGATVKVIRVSDSAVIISDVTDASGYLELTGLVNGTEYEIRISSPGYQTYRDVFIFVSLYVTVIGLSMVVPFVDAAGTFAVNTDPANSQNQIFV